MVLLLTINIHIRNKIYTYIEKNETNFSNRNKMQYNNFTAKQENNGLSKFKKKENIFSK